MTIDREDGEGFRFIPRVAFTVMARRTKTLPILAGASCLVVLLCASIAFRKPVLEWWYLWELESGDEEGRKVAAERLGDMGAARAIPKLTEAGSNFYEALIKERGDPFSLMAKNQENELAKLKNLKREVAFLKAMPPNRDGPDTDMRKRTRLLAFRQNVLQRLRIVTDSRVKQMEEILLNNDFSRALLNMNVTAGEAAIPYLIDELKNENWMRRWVAARLLGEMGPNAKDSVPGLERISGDENPFVRHEVRQTLERIEGLPPR